MAAILIDWDFQSLDSSGNPNNGGSLTFYDTGTTTPKTIYSDAGLTTAIANPVTLDSAGKYSGIIYAGDGERFSIIERDVLGATIPGANDPVWGRIESNGGVASKAALSALSAINGQIAIVGGDGYGQTYEFDSTSTATADGAVVISPGAGTGRWLLRYSSPVTARLWGAAGDGTTDDRAALALADAAGVPYSIENGAYRVASALTLSGEVIYNNGKLLPDSGITVTVSSRFGNPSGGQIFDVSAGGSFAGSSTLEMRGVLPTWFGASVSSSTNGVAFQAAVDFAEAMIAADTVAQQNTYGALSIDIPPGRWRTATLTTISLGGIVINGGGAGATHIECVSDLGVFRFRHADYMDGQNINNNGVRNLRILGTSATTVATNIGIEAYICRDFRVDNVRFENLAVMLDLNACEEPVHLDKLTFWHNNTNLTATSSLRIKALEVNDGTANAGVDADTGLDYYKNSQIFLDNCEFRSAASAGTAIALQHIYIDSCDGLQASNCHLIGGTSQVVFDPVSSALAIANVVFSDCFLDGELLNTDRNIYVQNKTFTTAMSDFLIKFYNCKINGADIENIRLDHADLEDFMVDGGLIDLTTGNYMVNAQFGTRLLSFKNVNFRLGGDGPDLGALYFDAENSTFFSDVRVKGCEFNHNGAAGGTPVRVIHIDSDGTNSPEFVIENNDYDNHASLVSFIDDDSAPAVTITERNNNPQGGLEQATGVYTIDVGTHVTEIDSSGGAVTATLGSGRTVGFIKTIVMTNATASSTVSVTNHPTSDPEVFTFNAVDETLVLMWTGTEWVTIHNQDVTV